MIAAQLVTFFMIMFIRLPWMLMLVSRIVVTRSRSDSVHSVARSTWSYTSWKYGIIAGSIDCWLRRACTALSMCAATCRRTTVRT